MVGSEVLEQFIFEGMLNKSRYLQFLRNNLDIMLANLDVEKQTFPRADFFNNNYSFMWVPFSKTLPGD